jgi:hypothetical protein
LPDPGEPKRMTAGAATIELVVFPVKEVAFTACRARGRHAA